MIKDIVVNLSLGEDGGTAGDYAVSRGVLDSIHLRMSPSARPAETTPSVAIMPGLTVLTRILRGASSFESTEEMASTEAFVAV